MESRTPPPVFYPVSTQVKAETLRLTFERLAIKMAVISLRRCLLAALQICDELIEVCK